MIRARHHSVNMSTYIHYFCISHAFYVPIWEYSKYATICCVKIKNRLRNFWIIYSKLADVNELLYKQPSKKLVSPKQIHWLAFITEVLLTGFFFCIQFRKLWCCYGWAESDPSKHPIVNVLYITTNTEKSHVKLVEYRKSQFKGIVWRAFYPLALFLFMIVKYC